MDVGAESEDDEESEHPERRIARRSEAKLALEHGPSPFRESKVVQEKNDGMRNGRHGCVVDASRQGRTARLGS